MSINFGHYQPSIGGHAPGDLRDAFLEAVDALEDWHPGSPEPTVDLKDRLVPISKVFGLCWNCNDILPSERRYQVAQLVDDEEPGTYAQASRLIMPKLS